MVSGALKEARLYAAATSNSSDPRLTTTESIIRESGRAVDEAARVAF